MNERYKELAIEANLGPACESQAIAIKKFAMLIVHQMLDITDAHTEVFQTDRDRVLIEHIKQSVKQHFGVEE
jgi:hypothetical protein